MNFVLKLSLRSFIYLFGILVFYAIVYFAYKSLPQFAPNIITIIAFIGMFCSILYFDMLVIDE